MEDSSVNRIVYKTFRVFILLTASLLVISGIYLYNWLNTLGVFQLDSNKITSLSHLTLADNTVIYDRNQERIGEFFDRYQIFVSANELPEHLIKAITSIEDRNFFEHRGIDFKALTRAAWARVRFGKITQGGSTITQQVTKQLLLTPERTLERKVLEIAWALKMEQTLSKNEILEIYVNSLFLGNGAYGVGAAARRYFGKDVRDLNVAESAVIAGLFQSPSRYNPARHPNRARKRQLAVIAAMKKSQAISHFEATEAINFPIKYTAYKPINYETAPWFVDWVREQLNTLATSNPDIKQKMKDSSGLRIYTTLDTRLQKFAESSIANYESTFENLEKKTFSSFTTSEKDRSEKSRIEASMLVSDPTSGEILAMVGGRDYKKSQFNRTASANRSPGSAFKPIVYAEALIKGWKWSDVIFVSPINIENYKPRTPEQDFLTETTMLRAFYRSMNTPTVEIANKVGLHNIIKLAKELGIRSPIKNELGSTLGSSEVTMFDLSRMYGTFANKGKRNELIGIRKIESSDGTILFEAPKDKSGAVQVVVPQIAFLVNEGMRSVLQLGTANKSSDLAAIAYGKTGTSNESADNWFCGSTSNLTATVWVGTDENVAIPGNVTGGGLALPIWDVFVRQAIRVKPPTSAPPPPGVFSAAIHPQYGNTTNSGVKMWFLESNKPNEKISALQNIENNASGEYRRVFTH